MNKLEKFGLLSAIIAGSGIFLEGLGVFRTTLFLLGTLGLICFWIVELIGSFGGE